MILVLRHQKVGAHCPGYTSCHSPCTYKPPTGWVSVPTGSVFRARFYTIIFLFISPLPPYTSSGTPPVSSIEEAPWGAYRSTPSAFLTHGSTHLVPVKPIAPLMVQNFIKALCRHAAFGLLLASLSNYTI